MGSRLPVQRCGGHACFPGVQEDETVQRHATGGHVSPTASLAIRRALDDPGQPLDSGTRATMEGHHLHDFSSVRVHSGWSADRAAQETGSAAFTTGNHLVFGAGRYSPATPDGRRTLSHELAHVVQQRSGPVAGAPAGGGLLVSHPDDAFERAADSAAARLPPSGATAPSAGTGQVRARPPGDSRRAVIQRQAAVPLAEPPAFELSPGEAANDNAEVDPVTGPQGLRYAPSPADNSLEAIFARAAIVDYRARTLAEQERPMATLSHGGNPSNGFITVEGTRRYDWIGGPGGGGSGDVRNRKFHVLDAIEYRVGRATTDEDLQAVVNDYLPTLGLMNELLRGRPQPFRLRPLSVPILDEPVFDPLFDPDGVARLATFEEALERRVQQVPALAESRLRSRRTRRGGCRLVPTEPLGDDPLSGIYCHAVTGSPFSYEIYLPQASGAGDTRRWAEIDALRGNTWFECKCGYEHLFESWRSAGILAEKTRQVLNHVAIARECGLEYRYIVSNERVRDFLQDQWFGNVVIDVRPWEPCGPS